MWNAKDLDSPKASAKVAPKASGAKVGPFALYNVKTEKCADIPWHGNGHVDGPVNQWTCDWSRNDKQLQYLDTNTDGSFVIRNAKDDLCMDVSGYDFVAAGTPISEYSCRQDTGDNQRFWLSDQTGRGDYWIIHEKSALCLDVAGVGTGGDGARLTLYDCSNADDHWWRFIV